MNNTTQSDRFEKVLQANCLAGRGQDNSCKETGETHSTIGKTAQTIRDKDQENDQAAESSPLSRTFQEKDRDRSSFWHFRVLVDFANWDVHSSSHMDPDRGHWS
jgi:hypothetical protein